MSLLARLKPRRSFNQQIRQLTTEAGIDYNSDAWKKYVSKRRADGQRGSLTNGQLGDLVNVLRDVKGGRLKFVMTPDGFITVLPY